MIHYFTPYSTKKNLGKAYNDSAALVTNPDDWIVFLDGDVCFLTSDWGNIIKENLSVHKEKCSLFTCITNRVGNKRQCYEGVISDNPNMLDHIAIAEELAKSKRHEIVYTDRVISGHLMIIQKSLWEKLGGAKNGLLGVDNYISRLVLQSGKAVGILQGLYVFHKYRINTHANDTSHLK